MLVIICLLIIWDIHFLQFHFIPDIFIILPTSSFYYAALRLIFLTRLTSPALINWLLHGSVPNVTSNNRLLSRKYNSVNLMSFDYPFTEKENKIPRRSALIGKESKTFRRVQWHTCRDRDIIKSCKVGSWVLMLSGDSLIENGAL